MEKGHKGSGKLFKWFKNMDLYYIHKPHKQLCEYLPYTLKGSKSDLT